MAGIIITVLLTILKIILFLLLAVLALVLLVLVLPIKYEANACGDSRKGLDSLHAKVRVKALLGIVKVKACFREGSLSYALKLFGKALVSGKQEIIKTKEAETADTEVSGSQETEPEAAEAAAETVSETYTAVPEPASMPAPEAGPESAETDRPDAGPESAETDRPDAGPETAAETAQQISYEPEPETAYPAEIPEQPSASEMAKRRKKEEKERKKEEAAHKERLSPGDRIKPVIEKAESVIAILQDPATHRTARRVKTAVFNILSHILPRKCRIKAKFGTGDPAMTGQILGGLYAFYPFYADRGDFEFGGDFEQAMLDGKLYVGGRVNPIVPAFNAAFLLRDGNIRKLIFGRKKK